MNQCGITHPDGYFLDLSILGEAILDVVGIEDGGAETVQNREEGTLGMGQVGVVLHEMIHDRLVDGGDVRGACDIVRDDVEEPSTQ